MNEQLINKWRHQKKISLDGYTSCTFDKSVAMKFAEMSYIAQAESDEKQLVLLKIQMDNESGKHYVNLDRHDYTCYPDEKEVLLQAGLMAEITNVE